MVDQRRRERRTEEIITYGTQLLEGEYPMYVMQTPSGQRSYYFDDASGIQERISKKDAEEVIKSVLHEYGYTQEYGYAGMDAVLREEYERVREYAPELLPKEFELVDTDDNSWKVNPDNFCPEGYEFVKAHIRRGGETVRGYCRRQFDVPRRTRSNKKGEMF